MIRPAPGYTPSRAWWKDILKRAIGAPNLFKRLQMSDILRALDLKPDDVALDFGCGRGHMTYEMAWRCRKAYGIDIVNVGDYLIPPELNGRVEFHCTRGEQTPFDNSTFDVILMSEVVATITDPRHFFAEVSRIIKPSGRIVIVNPLERLGIKRDYERNSGVVRLMHFLGRAPRDYDEYTVWLHRSFGNTLLYLPPEAYYHNILREVGYRIEQVIFTPSATAQELIERIQYVALCMGWPTHGLHYFLLYPLLKIIDTIAAVPRGTGCIMVAYPQA